MPKGWNLACVLTHGMRTCRTQVAVNHGFVRLMCEAPGNLKNENGIASVEKAT
jgi:hypothetical protein